MRLSRQCIERTYRAYAPVYDLVFGMVLEPGRRALAEAVSALQPRSVLEVGVGTGLTLERYPATASVHGIDFSEAMLEKARQRTRNLRGREIHLASMDAEAMSYPDESFDCVTLPYVLSVTPNPRRLVAEVRRVCRRGGAILVLNHFSSGGVWRGLERAFRPLADWVGFRTDITLEEHVLAYDWTVQSVASVNAFGLSRLVRIRN